jgi:SAM-dependent methyltransferase
MSGAGIQSFGPGAIAPDGSPVELYLTLPPGNEPEIVRAALPNGGSILELGCGVGRLTHPLLELGYVVVAVDNSARMLEHVRGAETHLCDIETLDLDRKFDGVLLASHLINTSDRGQRSSFLSTCRRHVTTGGMVLIQRSPPDREWNGPGIASDNRRGSIRIRIHDLARRGPVVESVAEYIDESRGQTWMQPFTAEILDDEALDAALADADLRRMGWLDEARTWIQAVPSQDSEGDGL